MQREQRLSNVLLGLFGGLSLLFLSLPLTSTVQSVKTFLSYTVHPGPHAVFWATEALTDVPANVSGLIHADQENRKLREDLAYDELLRAEAGAAQAENTRLRAQAGFAAPTGWSPVWARVMARSPQTWYRELVLDRGTDAGLEMGSPVLGVEEFEETRTPAPAALPPTSPHVGEGQGGGSSTAAVSVPIAPPPPSPITVRRRRLGVVGRVIEITPSSAKVLLLTDDLSSVAATVGPEDWEGLVEGDGRPRLRVNYVSEEAELRPGMSVFTSPASPSFPPGLPVGTVTLIGARDPLLAFQSVEVKPAVRLEALKEVMVLRRGKS